MPSNKPGKLKTFGQANLFMILPPIVIILVSIVLSPAIRLFTQNTTCDRGGSSLNVCEYTITLILATIISFTLTRFILKHFHVRWKSPLYGIALFYAIPIILLIIHLILTNGIYGNERGAINNSIIFISIPVIIVSIILLCYRNYQQYLKVNS